MIHAVLIDDEANGLKSLELLFEDLKEEVTIVGLTTDAFEAIKLINLYRPDIVFLDISMPQLDGFELLEQLSFKDFYLVFTTAHRQYALRALKQGATDYLLKPVDSEELSGVVKRIRQKIKEGKQQPDVQEILRRMRETHQVRILLPTKKGTEYVLPEDIIYIEAESNYSLVSLTSGETIEVTIGLKDFEQQLCRAESNFLRIHHSYIINLDYVTRYIKDNGGSVVMRGKKTIPISRQKKDQFLKLINFQV